MAFSLKPPRGTVSAIGTLADAALAFSTDARRVLMGDGSINHVLGVKHNIGASAAPGTGDDAADGYSPGSLWIDTTNDLAYVCLDSSAGAAVWQLIGSSSGGITQLTGDATAGPGSGSQALTLANSGVSAGSYGSSSAVPVLTFDAKGRCTSATTASIATGLDITGLTAADPADADELPIYDASASANRKVTVQEINALTGLSPGGRLTGSSTLPVTTGDTVISTLYYLPFVHNRVPLWDGTRWLAVTVADAGVSVALSGLTTSRPYDVFGYLSSGVLALEYLAWTSDTARATDVTVQDGRYCKSGDKTRLYLGTFYATGATTAADSVGFRYLWNMYNRRLRNMWVLEATNSWTYGTATWRSANNSTANRIRFVVGLAEDAVFARLSAMGYAPTGVAQSASIALDRTNGSDAQTIGYLSTCDNAAAVSEWTGIPAVGFHYLQWVEYTAAGTATWLGDGGVSYVQSGLVGEILG